MTELLGMGDVQSAGLNLDSTSDLSHLQVTFYWLKSAWSTQAKPSGFSKQKTRARLMHYWHRGIKTFSCNTLGGTTAVWTHQVS